MSINNGTYVQCTYVLCMLHVCTSVLYIIYLIINVGREQWSKNGSGSDTHHLDQLESVLAAFLAFFCQWDPQFLLQSPQFVGEIDSFLGEIIYVNSCCFSSPTFPGWWLTYPSEKWWSSSVGMIIPFPIWWKVIKVHGSKPPTSINYY